MRRTAFVLLTALCLSAPVMAQDNPMQATILNQLEAFKADDFATAFTFASPTIKGIFMTPQNFGAMVTQGYPMVHRPGAVKMLEAREVAGNLWQKVMITDQAGRTHILDYQMVETAEGWQINAVQLLPEPGVGA
ncbi:DUF4864 domain-containing protein [Paragemmobacter straminiformis]|uniref:DUF4864 domain-containing protein n=1 Tax=Paragemmobacter straminiformis TaxID=2045119 RepID=A0A842IAH0_9RHOB|nr:DUF4864 domain-containing protein [Gemmobacter straminiformis]MBC2836403.1 DUF4864 domain-containing protein [Gemmobacter straminiformis]